MIRIGGLVLEGAGSDRVVREGEGFARFIDVSVLLQNPGDAAALQAMLDAAGLAARGDAAGLVPVGIRPGRRMAARLLSLRRETHHCGGSAAVGARFRAEGLAEEAEEESRADAVIIARGQAMALNSSGTAPVPLRVVFTAAGRVSRPGFGGGLRAAVFNGVVETGSTLVLDGVAGRAALDGADVTAQIQGVWPLVAAGADVIQFNDDIDGSHAGAASFYWRDAWW